MEAAYRWTFYAWPLPSRSSFDFSSKVVRVVSATSGYDGFASQDAYTYHASEAEYKAEDAAFEHYKQAEAALTARGVTTLSDAVALMRTEAWRHDSFVREQYDGIRVSLELAEKVTGHWHVPDDVIRLDAEMQAKEDAYFRVQA